MPYGLFRHWEGKSMRIPLPEPVARRATGLAAAVFGCCATYFMFVAPASGQNVPDSVMTVLSTTRDRDGNVVARVQNTGTKTITAWEIAHAGAMPSWTERRLDPGNTLDGPDSWSPQLDDGTIPKVLAVVFQDGTSVGDMRAAEEIFTRRQGAADEFAHWHNMPTDWTNEHFADEFRRTREAQAGKPTRSAYEVGVLVAVSQIKGAIQQYKVAELREFLADSTRSWQQGTRSMVVEVSSVLAVPLSATR